MAAGWKGAARMGLGWVFFMGAAGDTCPHAHHAIQVLLADAPKRVWTSQRGWQEVRGLMIGPDLAHALAPGAERVTLIYVEPESESGARLRLALSEGVRELTDAERIAIQLEADPATQPDRVLVHALEPGVESEPASRPDPVIDRIIASIPSRLERPVSAAQLAEAAGLSASRFQHRFRARTGLALRPYLRWRRLLIAMAAVMHGESLTDAALSGGFADAAHFTRTVRRHFGITPGMMAALGR
jgi:AraC-like DNA-binding protein